MHFLMLLKVNNVNNYNHVAHYYKMHESNKCAPVPAVKLDELDTSGEHLPLYLYMLSSQISKHKLCSATL